MASWSSRISSNSSSTKAHMHSISLMALRTFMSSSALPFRCGIGSHDFSFPRSVPTMRPVEDSRACPPSTKNARSLVAYGAETDLSSEHDGAEFDFLTMTRSGKFGSTDRFVNTEARSFNFFGKRIPPMERHGVDVRSYPPAWARANYATLDAYLSEVTTFATYSQGRAPDHALRSIMHNTMPS